MKKITFYFLAFMLTAFIFVSCSKTGAVGPTGPAGSTGATGAVGPAGPAGADGKNGSVIYSGTTDPSATTGAIGDFYINLTTGLLFGPKTDGGWGTGVSLKGATGTTGAKGTAGSQIYKGSGTPPAATGVNGDYYLDSTNFLLYGPKTSAGWGTPIALQGPAGPAGPQGPAGNANVKTDVFTLANADWKWNSQYVYETSANSYTEYFTRYAVRANANITQDILTNGMVLVYFQPSPVNNPNDWAPLPYQFDSSFGYLYNYVAVTAVGQVTFHFFFTQDDNTATVPTLSSYPMETRQYKIVVVAGQEASFMKANHIDVKNYAAVSKITGLWQQNKN